MISIYFFWSFYICPIFSENNGSENKGLQEKKEKLNFFEILPVQLENRISWNDEKKKDGLEKLAATRAAGEHLSPRQPQRDTERPKSCE